MKDFGDKEYPGMVCVETTNADKDVVTVPPSGEHRLSAAISVEKSKGLLRSKLAKEELPGCMKG